MIEPLDNRNPEHRQALIAALAVRGLEAHEERSGGSNWHVSIYLINQGVAWLRIYVKSPKTGYFPALFLCMTDDRSDF